MRETSEAMVGPGEVKLNLSSGKFKTTENERGKSDVWKNFSLVVDADTNETVGYVKCKRCGDLLQYDSKRTGNSPLNRHMEKVTCKSSGGLLLQGDITSYVTTAPKKFTQKSKSRLILKCVGYCCKDVRPFLSIEGEGFEELAQELIHIGATYGHISAKDVLPDRTTVSNRTNVLAVEKRKQLIEALKDVLCEVNTIGMTTDMWTEDYHKTSYMSITCHFITSEFELIGKVLTTAVFPPEERHTGENIRREIIRLLVTEYGLDPLVLSKVVWVTDQGSNIIAALRPYTRLDCQDHVYNTVMRHALDPSQLEQVAPEVASTIQAAKSLVKFVKKSGIAALLPKTVNQMGDTRFSTVYLTLKSIQDVYTELREILEGRGEAHRIAAIAPDVLAFLVTFLKEFYDAQRILEGDKYTTINLVYRWLCKLKVHCRERTTDLPYQARITC